MIGWLAVALVVFQCPDGAPPPCRAARAMRTGPAPMSVAVLQFESLSADTADRYLSEGLAEELTSRLGQVQRLTVASRTAVRRLRDAASMSTPEIGRALNVNYLLNGSVRRAGTRLRVTVELVRASGGAQVWSSQYDRSEQDLLAIQEAVASAVATAVAGRLLPGERTTLATRPTNSPGAYDAYLRGRLLYLAGVPARQQEAVALFERATSLDSSFALAWAFMSRAHMQMFWYYVDRSDDRIARARLAAQRASALAPEAAETHLALGYLSYWGTRDYGRALQEFSAALVARPNDSEVHAALANVARRQGSWEQSVASRARALEIDPGSALELSEGGLTLHALRRYDEAEALYERAIAIPGDYIYPNFFAPGLALARDGSVERQRRRLDFLAAHVEDVAERTFHDPGIALPVWRTPGPHQAAILASHPAPTAGPEARAQHYIVVGQVLSGQGNREGAATAYDSVRVIVTGLLAQRPNDDGFHAQISLAYAGLGRCDDAIREAERAVALLPVSADALTGPQRVQSLAEVEATCGRAESAIGHLAYLLTIPSFVTPALLRADPVFAPLRGNPGFERLVAGP